MLVVDDGSTDDTARNARAGRRRRVADPFNLGIGGAMQAGYLYALEHGYDVAVQVDGDGQHDPRHIPDLLEHLHADPELDMVTGSRFLTRERRRLSILGGAPRRHPHLLDRRLAHHRPARHRSDLGFRMTSRRGIELFARDYPHDYPEVEAILLMHAHRPAQLSRSPSSCARGRPASRRSPRRSRSTTWSRSCSPCSSGCFRRARPSSRDVAPRRSRSARMTHSPSSAARDRAHARAAGLVFELVRRRAAVGALRDPVAARRGDSVRARRLEGAA